MDWMQQKVREFHLAMGEPAPDRPDLGGVRLELRARLILEEAIETAEALGFDVVAHSSITREKATVALRRDRDPNWPEVVDGLCDLAYVTLGTAVEAGLDLAVFFAEVHRSNMRKTGGPRSAHGKVLKPDGWEPPRIRYLLDRAMSRGEAS